LPFGGGNGGAVIGNLQFAEAGDGSVSSAEEVQPVVGHRIFPRYAEETMGDRTFIPMGSFDDASLLLRDLD